jgi:hypothetical protein
MPNHVFHRCEITGDANEIERLRSLVLCTDEDGELEFSCQAVIPMPEILEGSEKEELGTAVLGQDIPDRFGGLFGDLFDGTSTKVLDQYLTYEWVKSAGVTTRDQLVSWVTTTQPDTIERGKRTIECIKQTGYADWYDWRCNTWGTKWGCYDYQEVSFTQNCWAFTFESAWSPPEPVLNKLFRELFPTLKVVIAFADEMPNYAGTGLFQNGEGGLSYTEDNDEMRPLYERCTGRPMDDEWDDDEDEDEDEDSPKTVASPHEHLEGEVKPAIEEAEAAVTTG